MKLKHTLIALPLLAALYCSNSHAAVSGDPEAVSKEYAGVMEITPYIPVTGTSYSTGSYFFFDTGEGADSGISLGGASGSIPRLFTYYVPGPSMLIAIADSESPLPNPGTPANPVPLPPAIALLASGLAGLAALKRMGKMQTA